ncbi:MAG: peptidoglycan recognition protein family protein [Micromonosporaceae bacterium]
MDREPTGLARRHLFKAGLGVATVSVFGSGIAAAAASETAADGELPWIISCDEWGARPPDGTPSQSQIATNKIIVHHMAFPNVTDYSREQAVKLARDCQDLHMDRNGWMDTGQHFTVSRGGYVMEGRHGSLAALEQAEHQIISAHCPGENGRSIGIECEGTYITEIPTEALFDSVTKLCVAICQQYGLHAWDVFGHWDFRNTQCPGIAYYREFPGLRRRIAAGLGEPASAAPKRRWPDIWRFVGGPVVKVTQYLLNAHGHQLATDGVFGPKTVAAVQDWQASHDIPVDVDATMTTQTWETLAPQLDGDSTGAAVTAVQYILGHKGYDVTETGVYDEATVQAVREVQRLHGIAPDGDVSLETWCVITGGIVRDSFSDE